MHLTFSILSDFLSLRGVSGGKVGLCAVKGKVKCGVRARVVPGPWTTSGAWTVEGTLDV